MRALIAVATLSVAASPNADATPTATAFHDPLSDFSIELNVPEAAICYLKPKAMRADGTGCEGIDVAAATETIPPETRLTALIRFEDWGYTVTGTWLPKRKPGPMSRENGQEVLRGAAAAAARGTFKVAQQEPEFLIVNDLQVLRFTLVSADANAPVNAILNYLVVGKDSIVQVSFLTSSAHLGSVKERSERAMASLRMPAVHTPASWSDSPEDSRAYQVGYHATKAVLNLLLLAGICVGAVFLYRAIRRSRATDVSK